MKKPVFAMLLGGFLGIFDGLSALISAPQEAPNIVGIVIGSTFKGVLAGAIIGLVAQRTQSLGVLVTVGLAIGDVNHEQAIGGRGGVVAARCREGGSGGGHGTDCTGFV